MGLPLSAIQLPRGPFFANETGVVGTRHRRFLGEDGGYFRFTARPKTPLWASWGRGSGGGKRPRRCYGGQGAVPNGRLVSACWRV